MHKRACVRTCVQVHAHVCACVCVCVCVVSISSIKYHEIASVKAKAAILHYSKLLAGRKQRTKVNNSFSTCQDIISGIPQGSILGPLLFNIYINDIFFFINQSSLANYADDNTLYTMGKDIDDVLNTFLNNINILKDWFRNNYCLLNKDKCNLLITNHVEDIFLKLGNENITGKKWVKLLGIKVDKN